MSPADRRNRARWVADQRSRASAHFAEQLKQDRAVRLMGLRDMLAGLEGLVDPPELALQYIAEAKAEIARLESQS